MAQRALFVFTDPVEGKEEEYNDWYNNVHLAEVCQVEGFLSAQRFESIRRHARRYRSRLYRDLPGRDERPGQNDQST